MLRRFIEEESDTYVGKMIILLVNYMRENLLDKNISQEDINKLYELGKIKLGKVPTNHKAQKSDDKAYIIDFEYLKKGIARYRQETNATTKRICV